MRKQTPVKVITDEEKPEPVEIIAKSILQIAEGFSKLTKSGLNEQALIILLQSHIGAGNITKHQIGQVLRTLPELGKLYLRK